MGQEEDDYRDGPNSRPTWWVMNVAYPTVAGLIVAVAVALYYLVAGSKWGG